MADFYINPIGILVKRELVNTKYRWWAFSCVRNEWFRSTMDESTKKLLVPYYFVD